MDRRKSKSAWNHRTEKKHLALTYFVEAAMHASNNETIANMTSGLPDVDFVLFGSTAPKLVKSFPTNPVHESTKFSHTPGSEMSTNKSESSTSLDSGCDSVSQMRNASSRSNGVCKSGTKPGSERM
ncbi:hypothetical protein BCR44DRAFT_1281912 [Catenaria anguillulae PL171]|uniref:Uncharacterized protein n=1 Tax=Catenaria anguillulae PL171 TaxID=765915 RepID=A0A1Y2HW24_9FUNG|nr:hypothetical protein BCR44DRAFT_1281912 [Catenaria anguillulae PL171]